MKHLVRFIPPVHEIQKEPLFTVMQEEFSLDHTRLTNAVKSVLDDFRNSLLNGEWEGPGSAGRGF